MYQLIAAAAGAILGGITQGVTTALTTNQKVKALQDAANQAREMANKYSGTELNRKMTEAGAANAQRLNQSDLANQLNQMVNTSGAAMANANNNPNFQNNYADYYKQGADREASLNAAQYGKEQADIERNLKQADVNYNVANQTAQAGLNAAGGLASVAGDLGNFNDNNPQTRTQTMYNVSKDLSKVTPTIGTRPTSDENLKEPINNDSGLTHADIQDSLRQLESVKYKYTDEAQEINPNSTDNDVHVGSVTQSYEKTPLFESAVVKDENGVGHMDLYKLNEALAAGLAEMQREIDSLSAPTSDEQMKTIINQTENNVGSDLDNDKDVGINEGGSATPEQVSNVVNNPVTPIRAQKDILKTYYDKFNVLPDDQLSNLYKTSGGYTSGNPLEETYGYYGEDYKPREAPYKLARQMAERDPEFIISGRRNNVDKWGDKEVDKLIENFKNVGNNKFEWDNPFASDVKDFDIFFDGPELLHRAYPNISEDEWSDMLRRSDIRNNINEDFINTTSYKELYDLVSDRRTDKDVKKKVLDLLKTRFYITLGGKKSDKEIKDYVKKLADMENSTNIDSIYTDRMSIPWKVRDSIIKRVLEANPELINTAKEKANIEDVIDILSDNNLSDDNIKTLVDKYGHLGDFLYHKYKKDHPHSDNMPPKDEIIQRLVDQYNKDVKMNEGLSEDDPDYFGSDERIKKRIAKTGRRINA